jgi:hypothetical protein
MSSMAKKYAPAKTAFWIASILTVVLLAIHVLVSTQVTQYEATDLGLLTKLPITFWIGLSSLGALLYVSRKSQRRTVIVVVLISFYLFGIPVLIRENKAEDLAISYWLSSQGAHITSEGRLDFSTINPEDFRNWPGFFFITAFLSSSTGLPATVFADYFPLLTIALLGMIAYSILRLRLSALYSSLGALWVIGCLWTGQHYFSPQGTAYLMYFAVFLLLAKLLSAKKQNMAFPLIIIFLFIATVITHLLTSFIIVVGVIAIYALYKIFSRRVKVPPFYSIATCIVIATIFFSYQTLVIQRSFSTIIEVLYGQILRQENPVLAIAQPRAGGSTSLLLQVVSTYSITILNVGIAILAILATALGLWFHKKEAKNDVFWIAWIIAAGIFGVSMMYGTEAINRAFMFMLLPASYFAIKFLSKMPRILILVLVILIFIHIPAQYSNQNCTYVPTSELKGCAFYTKYAPSTAPFFYEPVGVFLPTGVINGTQISITLIAGLYSLPSQKLVNETTGSSEFIISSNLEKNYYLYFYGVDPLEHLNLDDHYNRIYDNEGFHIYGELNPHA